MSRIHLSRTGLGNNSTVKFYDLSDGILWPGNLYTSATGSGKKTNPFVALTGVLDVWIEGPADLRITITPSGGVETPYDKVVVPGSGSDGEDGAATLLVEDDANPGLYIIEDA